jgi:hypothetical protein
MESMKKPKNIHSQPYEIQKYINWQQQQIKELTDLLKIAKCNYCDGSGAIQTRVIKSGSKQISDTEWEEIPIEDFDIEPCQWCDERKQALK